MQAILILFIILSDNPVRLFKHDNLPPDAWTAQRNFNFLKLNHKLAVLLAHYYLSLQFSNFVALCLRLNPGMPHYQPFMTERVEIPFNFFLQILINGVLYTYLDSLYLYHNEELVSKFKNVDVSIIIPTYNESENILKLIDAIKVNLPEKIIAEIIIVDDNSPDGTGTVVENYIRTSKNSRPINNSQLPRKQKVESNTIDDSISSTIQIKVLHRENKVGLIPVYP